MRVSVTEKVPWGNRKKKRLVRGRVNGAPPQGVFSTLKLNYSFEKCGGEF